MKNETQWERHAAWWQRHYSQGADPEYEDHILPLVAYHAAGARRVLDIGCGEGQVARQLAASGAQVVGLDPTAAQITAASGRAGGPRYLRGRAEALPCGDAAFDTVVLCAALEHVEDFEVALQEVARVLEPGGRFVLVLAHPFLQTPGAGWVDDRVLNQRYWRIGAYLEEERAFHEAAPGVELLFVHRPLSRYVRAMGRAGLLIDDMDETPPPPRLTAAHWDFPEAATIPRVLLVRAIRAS